jgi:hypothetical protein
MGKREERRAFKQRAISMFLIQQNAHIHTSYEALATIERYPTLAQLPTSQILLTCARNLDALSEEYRAQALEGVEMHDQDIQTSLAEFPPMPGQDERLQKDEKLARLVAAIKEHSALTTRKRFTLVDHCDKPAA